MSDFHGFVGSNFLANQQGQACAYGFDYHIGGNAAARIEQALRQVDTIDERRANRLVEGVVASDVFAYVQDAFAIGEVGQV